MGSHGILADNGTSSTCLTPARRPSLEALEGRLLLDGGAAGQQAVELFGVSAALFAENQGQWADPAVHYAFNGDGANVLFTDAGPVFQVFSREARGTGILPVNAERGTGVSPVDEEPNGSLAQQPTGETPVPHLADDGQDYVERATQFSVQFDGANTVSPVGLEQAETVFNYHIGDQSTWRDNVSTYETVAYLGLYDGIDLHTWGRRDSLKYEFHVAPGADYTQIEVSYAGIEGLSIDVAGALHVQTELGDLIDPAPYIYQDIAGARIEVAGAFELIGQDTYTFTLTGDYDPNAELIIDPDLSWSTYMGGSGKDWGEGIAVDGSGGVYVTGYTDSPGRASNGFDTTYNGASDIFVAKLTSDGDHAWSTYMGGSGNDYGFGIAVDDSGGVYVTGKTYSSGWVSGGFDTSHNGDWDIFVAKLTSVGGHAWSTYMGGSSADVGTGIAPDRSGGVFVTGWTESPGWASGGFDTLYDGEEDIFVAKLTSVGGHAWSTYMGGSDDDYGSGVAVDGSGDVYVAGETFSSGWVSGGFDESHNGGSDVFVAKLTSVGGHAWSTYMGGSDYDEGYGIAVDGSGGAYVTGETASPGWASDGFDTTLDGESDAFVAKLTSVGVHAWSTYTGGGEWDYGSGIAVDGFGGVYVTGETASPGWASGGFDTTLDGESDAFVAKLNSVGGHAWSTYMGGSSDDEGLGIAVDGSGGVHVTGGTESAGWVSGGFDTSHDGDDDIFVAKIRGTAANSRPDGPEFVAWADGGVWSDEPPRRLIPDREYGVKVQYTDRDGRADLDKLYLRLATGDRETPPADDRQTLMHFLDHGAVVQWANETHHLYDVSASRVGIPGGYEVTWAFKINSAWEQSANVDFYAWALDNSAGESPQTKVDANARYGPDPFLFGTIRDGDLFDSHDGDAMASQATISWEIDAISDTPVAVQLWTSLNDGPFEYTGAEFQHLVTGGITFKSSTVFVPTAAGEYDFRLDCYVDGEPAGSYGELGLTNVSMETPASDYGAPPAVNGTLYFDTITWNKIDSGWEGGLDSTNVSVDSGNLVLRVDSGTGIGAQVNSPEVFHYGYYSAEIKAAAPTTGPEGICQGFFYYFDDNSEIDVEILSAEPGYVNFVVHGVDRDHFKIEVPNQDTEYHEYGFDWQAGRVDFYLDGGIVATTTQDIPSQVGTLIINAWSDEDDWAGRAPQDADRVMHVRDVTTDGNVLLNTLVVDSIRGGVDTFGVDGAVTLGANASLEIVPVGGGKEFTCGTYTLIEAAGGLTGTFANVTAPGSYVSVNGNGLTYNPSGTVTLTLDKNLNPADGNMDGRTDVSDRIIWNTNNFTFNTTWATGDWNNDGQTDVSDRIIWNSHNFTFATACPQGAPAADADEIDTAGPRVGPVSDGEEDAMAAAYYAQAWTRAQDEPAEPEGNEVVGTSPLVPVMATTGEVPRVDASSPEAPPAGAALSADAAAVDAAASDSAELEPDIRTDLPAALGEALEVQWSLHQGR